MTIFTESIHDNWPGRTKLILYFYIILIIFLMVLCKPVEAGAHETIIITSGNDTQWSTNLSNNVSDVAGNIVVDSGAVLNLENATIYMNSTSAMRLITVHNNGKMNINGSLVTLKDTASLDYYNWTYEYGSMGNVTNTIIKFCIQDKGFEIETSKAVSLFNVTFDHGKDSCSSYAIFLNSSGNTCIRNCTINCSSTNLYKYGIYMQDSSNCNLSNNTITNCDDDGIYIGTSKSISLFNNILTNNKRAINIYSSCDNTLKYNTMINSSDYNLYITGDYDQEIDTTNTVNGGSVYYRYSTNGTFSNTNIGHITIANCSDLLFTNCTIHNGDGIRIIGSSSNVSITNSDIENNTMYGINFELTALNNISNITIKNNTKQGIYLNNSGNNTISNSHILNNSDEGVYSKGSSSYNQIINNSITNNLVGIHLIGNGYNNLTDNNISDNHGNGVNLGTTGHYDSGYNILHNNTILSNNDSGIYFYTSYNNLTNNNISGNNEYAIFFMEISTKYLKNYILRSNTANGEQINYYYNENGITVESKYLTASNISNVGKITIVNCHDFNIRNNIFSNNGKSNGAGIFLWNSYENDLTNNTISNNYHGIELYNSSNNDITGLRTVSPDNQYYGAHFDSNSNYNNITESIIAGITYSGMSISSSDHNIITNTRISSVIENGVYIGDNCIYTNLTNVTITSIEADGVETGGDHTTINESNITAGARGVYFGAANYTNITNTNITAGTDGINMSDSNRNDLKNNTIDAIHYGFFLSGSKNNSLTLNTITNYTLAGILLEEYSTNTTMIGNDLTRNGAEFDIRINDSNDAIIAPNSTVIANYTFYLTDDTRLCTLDTVFNKTKVYYEDTTNLTLMWRMDVLCWDNYNQEAMWSNLSVRYSDFSVANGSMCWDGEISTGADTDPGKQSGRLSGNLFSYRGPPNSSDKWLPIIEYKQNATGKNIYQPMNCTTINRWDRLQNRNDTFYRNITTAITQPGVTITVSSGYTPNGRCYYCHNDKLTNFLDTTHWTEYDKIIKTGDPYTPGRCIDCHHENDSLTIPHGNESGKDLLYQPSPQLCYNGIGNQTCHNSSAIRPTLNQMEEFNKTTHHPLGDGKLACKACHDNHGTEHKSDLLKYYDITDSTSPYNSANHALCFVCHLEEKIVARMAESGTNNKSLYLQDYSNQTNFRDEYNDFSSGFKGELQNVHSPQIESEGTHGTYNCYACHNPHGAVDPAMTRYRLNYTYITNLTPPGVEYENGDWANQTVLDQANWSNSTLNQAGGTWTRTSECDGFGCHGGGYNTFGNLPDHFAYREFIDYEPAGGAGCIECHDSGRSSAIRPIVNVTAIKLAMHTNLSWNFRNGGILRGTNRNFTEWLEYRNYTSQQIANISEDNAICWACHSTNGTPPFNGFHPDRAMNPYKCSKCHGPPDGQPPHTQGYVRAIDNHGPTTKGIGSINIQTNVGTNGSCGDCHAPSKLPENLINNDSNSDDDLEVWKWGDGSSGTGGGWIAYTGRTTMGDVSHYGLNKSQGQALGIDNPLFNTSDCLYCHCNEANGAIWGNAINVSGNMYGADTSNLSECYTYCHVLPDYLYNVTQDNIPHFHNKTLYAGGGFDCVICHDINSSYGVKSRVDADAIAAGIHGNVTINTYTDILECDPRSKSCWGCHNSEGTQPEGMGDRNGIYTPQKKPWSCEDCHCRSDEWNAATGFGEIWLSSSYPPNVLPPRIYAHHPNSSTLRTNVVGNGSCIDCHNNSINQSHADTYGQILTNTVLSNISHYGTNVDLIKPTENCAICHNNTANGTKWGYAPQNNHGNFTNCSNTEDGCYICHTNDNQTPVDFHADNLWSGKGGFDCLRCHNNSGFAKNKRINGSVFGEAIHKNVNNASTMEYYLNRSCWACHFEEGLNADNHSMRKDPPYLCYDCHNKNNIPFGNVSNAPEVHNHFKSGTNISAYWTRSTDSHSCMGCHNRSEMFYYYLPDENEINPYYTNFSLSSHYGSNRTDLDIKYHNETNPDEYCGYCHVNTSTVFMEYENDKNIRHGGTSNCSDCHGTGKLHNITLTRAKTSGNCTNCHALYGNNRISIYEINVTAINQGVHANVNNNMLSIAGAAPISDANNSICWGCHVPNGAYPENGHADTFNNDAYLCYECHNGTAAYVNVSSATGVYNHFKGGINITARTDASTNSTSCGYGCHNLTSMKVSDFNAGGNASYRVNLSQASHYPRNRTDIAIQSDLSDCTWCHKNATNEFLGIFNNTGNANINHATDISGCILPVCHNNGRIHDLVLSVPSSIDWNECEDCHFGLSSYNSSAYVNRTMFDASVHASINCSDCHINATLDHPVEEYTWKWCECCHSYQSDPVNMSDRHNVTGNPLNYTLEVEGSGICVMNITDCTICHDADDYNSAVNDTQHTCRYCHAVPDKGNKTTQNWY